jgi:hypothetical protein
MKAVVVFLSFATRLPFYLNRFQRTLLTLTALTF